MTEVSDPRQVLGVRLNDGPEEIRAAYLRKVKEFPPERCPEEFEAIRDAFESLNDVRKATLAMLRSGDPRASMVSVLEGEQPRRPYAGPQAWLDVLKDQGLKQGPRK